MPKDKDTPAPIGPEPQGRRQDDERNRSFPIISPIGISIPFYDPTVVPKKDLVTDPPVEDEDPSTQ